MTRAFCDLCGQPASAKPYTARFAQPLTSGVRVQVSLKASFSRKDAHGVAENQYGSPDLCPVCAATLLRGLADTVAGDISHA